MKDPQRLLDAPASELELRLLRAGAEEQPPAAALQRLAAKLGAHQAVTPIAAGKAALLPIGLVAAGITLACAIWLANQSTPPPQAASTPPTQAPAVVKREAQPENNANSLAVEIARIDAIRQALAMDQKSAISAVQAYQRDFPHGALRQEAEALAIEAHHRAGDRRRARTLASRFLSEHPESPHNARVRDLLEALGPDAR